jgi:hypothetical protein
MNPQIKQNINYFRNQTFVFLLLVILLLSGKQLTYLNEASLRIVKVKPALSQVNQKNPLAQAVGCLR